MNRLAWVALALLWLALLLALFISADCSTMRPC